MYDSQGVPSRFCPMQVRAGKGSFIVDSHRSVDGPGRENHSPATVDGEWGAFRYARLTKARRCATWQGQTRIKVASKSIALESSLRSRADFFTSARTLLMGMEP